MIVRCQDSVRRFGRGLWLAAALADVTPGAQAQSSSAQSGDGWFTREIAKVVRHVVAIDIDGMLLETARLRLSESGLSNCDFVQGDACELASLWPEPVDFIFMANAFHGVPDKGRLAASVHGALKTSGRFAVVNWHTRPREETVILGEPRGPKTGLRIAPEGVRLAVESSGLRLVHVVEIPPYHYAAVFEKEKAVAHDSNLNR